jgi:hypothetical protein
VRRVARVAAGLARPSTRPRYVDAIRRRLQPDNETYAEGERCLVCDAARPKLKTIRYAKDPTTVCEVRICRSCGHVGNPDNIHDYRRFKKPEELPMRARVGTEDRQGREFHMAEMAAQIMGRSGLSVLVYGAGRSIDNRHIGALSQVKSVAIADVMQLRNDADFIDINQPTSRQFNLVIASEVVEHFLNPSQDFPALFRFVDTGGLLVCSTNVYDGSNLEKHKYIFTPGHTSYYTPEALTYIARSNGFYIDFRVPLVATGYAGPRKRYLFLTREASLLTDIARYFGRHMYAPSEQPWANKELEQARREREARQRREDANPATR